MKKYLAGIYVILGILIGFFGYQEFSKTPVINNQNYERFGEVLTTLQNLYYDQEKINTGEMIENAIKAYVDALEDPYTSYLDAETNSGFQEELKGESNFEGIGAVISKKDYYVLVEEVIKDSPAFKAGVQPLDRIVFIGSGETKNLSINEAVKQIRGPKGSIVSILIERVNKDETKELLEKKVTRNTISVPSVTSKILTGEKNIGYLEISVIGEETENLLKKELLSFKNQKIQGIIIDLRGNGGGFLPIAVEIASHFVPKKKLIVSSKYKQLGEEEFYSRGYESLNVPVVVLIDGFTASAGEIIALALQEQIGSKLIGTQTFGKGSIQTMEDFDDGASLKYTIGKRYSPSGKNIDKIGITPDIVLEFDSEAYKNNIDNQLEKAKETLLNM
ncbi:Peptidase S41A [candidate division SR1 bacterium RAAC1_SR1_1]|nr:Peptidase S41A [candidate division SR1 bacterium RAAC1_SR1_1]